MMPIARATRHFHFPASARSYAGFTRECDMRYTALRRRFRAYGRILGVGISGERHYQRFLSLPRISMPMLPAGHLYRLAAREDAQPASKTAKQCESTSGARAASASHLADALVRVWPSRRIRGLASSRMAHLKTASVVRRAFTPRFEASLRPMI